MTEARHILPEDAEVATLVGRVWSAQRGLPVPVLAQGETLHDLSFLAPTMCHLLERPDLAACLYTDDFPVLCSLDTAYDGAVTGEGVFRLLAPCDLQAVKAAGVTFAGSMLERVIEERAGGDPARADALREDLSDRLGEDAFQSVRPGSEAALRLLGALRDAGLWSQYLEVGLGPDAEIFTKAQPLSAVGGGAAIGVRPDSQWSNPEPEVVLVVNSRRKILGATLGNDVNLRDLEGRSALLLSKAKDNNASCAIGPFIRLFDDRFTLDDVRRMTLRLEISGADDGFSLRMSGEMAQISRDPEELLAQAMDRSHQYPDGMVLFLGAACVPLEDRHTPGGGFTHQLGDRVEIISPKLGKLVNTVTTSDLAPPWTFGQRALIDALLASGVRCVARTD